MINHLSLNQKRSLETWMKTDGHNGINLQPLQHMGRANPSLMNCPAGLTFQRPHCVLNQIAETYPEDMAHALTDHSDSEGNTRRSDDP